MRGLEFNRKPKEVSKEVRTLYFDCFAGISGDMTLGALIDCGVDGDALKNELKKLGIDGYRIEISRSKKNGISGTNVSVILDEDIECGSDENAHAHINEHEHEHIHGHGHEHSHGDHDHSHDHASPETVHHHSHRNLGDIENIIDSSEISPRAKELSKLMFRRVASAEAKIHGKPVDEVHFHEVGAVDSIIDIVGTAICIDMLNIDNFVSSPVNTGMGFVKCQHGIIPVPGPAALELLKDVPVYSLDVNTELTTPTGAAIISSLCSSFGPLPGITVEKIGYGCGKKDLEIPNLLRIVIGESKKKLIPYK